MALAVSGGHAVAHAPEHVLVVPVSCANRYRVRPCESGRLLPGLLLLAPPTVAGAPPPVVGDVVDGVAALPLLPQPATASAMSGAAAAPLMKVAVLRRVMVIPTVAGYRVPIVEFEPARSHRGTPPADTLDFSSAVSEGLEVSSVVGRSRGNAVIQGAAERHVALLQRDRELERIRRCIHRALQGRGSALLVEGPAGRGDATLPPPARHSAEAAQL